MSDELFLLLFLTVVNLHNLLIAHARDRIARDRNVRIALHPETAEN